MQVTISRGPGRTAIQLNIISTDTIFRIMELIKDRIDIPTERQRLRLNNLVLERDRLVCEYNISNGTTIHLQVDNSRNSNNNNARISDRRSITVTNFKKRQSSAIRRKKYRVKSVTKRRVIQ